MEDDEKLVAEIEAELWAASSNPIARFIGAIIKVIYLILGMKKEGYLVLTDKRVIEVVSQKACWVFNTGKEVKYVLPSSVKEVGYTKEGTFLVQNSKPTDMRWLSVQTLRFTLTKRVSCG